MQADMSKQCQCVHLPKSIPTISISGIATRLGIPSFVLPEVKLALPRTQTNSSSRWLTSVDPTGPDVSRQPIFEYSAVAPTMDG